jgi:hypothetical protein
MNFILSISHIAVLRLHMSDGNDKGSFGSKKASGACLARGILQFLPRRRSVAGENASPKSLRIRPIKRHYSSGRYVGSEGLFIDPSNRYRVRLTKIFSEFLDREFFKCGWKPD